MLDRRPPEVPEGWVTRPPDFVGIGAQRSGTSWWYHLVLDHPGVSSAPGAAKELHYFDRWWAGAPTPDELGAYARFFPRPPGALAGEWTPRYMADAWTPPLLAAAAPDAKLLILLRDPVERCRSGIQHALSIGAPPHPLIVSDAVARGFYARQLAHVFRHIDPSNVFVLQFERCLADRSTQLERTYRFLGLDPQHAPERLSKEPRSAEPAAPFRLDGSFREELVRLYEDDVRRLLELVPDIDPSLWRNFSHLALAGGAA